MRGDVKIHGGFNTDNLPEDWTERGRVWVERLHTTWNLGREGYQLVAVEDDGDRLTFRRLKP